MNRSARPGRHAAGFTLIELMVALLLSLLLAVGLIRVGAGFAQQHARNGDVATRDMQARAAMDLITRDLSGAGFLFGGTQNFCSALVTYDGAAPGAFVHHPVDAVAAATGTSLAFAPTLALNYPATGSKGVSDVLVTTGSTTSTPFNDTVYPIAIVAPNPAYQPTTTGVLQLASGLNASIAPNSDVAILQMPLGGKRACLRVPIASVSGQVVTSAGPLMPSGYYAGFGAALASAGYAGTLSDAAIYQGQMVDMGATATPLQATTAWYVDGSGSFPMLMRATYSLLDDTAIGAPQAIAAGVVSLQVLFGVDPGQTGAVTAYEPAATVTANQHWDAVLTTQVALVTRTIVDDPDAGYVGPTTVTLGAPFADLTVPASRHRYLVLRSEIANRNLLWR